MHKLDTLQKSINKQMYTSSNIKQQHTTSKMYVT